MLTIVMAEVFPEIQMNNLLMCHVLEKHKEKKDKWAYMWYFKFLFQALVSHTALLLSIIVVLKAQEEFAILNDSIGILVIACLNITGTKLFMEDFKIDFNKLYTDDDFLACEINHCSLSPIHTVMKLFRPNFFLMVMVLLYLWNDIFALMGTLNETHFIVIVILWVCMLLFALLAFTCKGKEIFARIQGLIDSCKKKEESSDEED